MLRFNNQYYICTVCFCCMFFVRCWLVSPVMVLMYVHTCSLLFMSLVLLGLVKICFVLYILCLSLFLLCSWIVFVDLVGFAFWRFILLEFWSFGVLFCILRHACDNFLFLFSVFSLKFVFVYPNRE